MSKTVLLSPATCFSPSFPCLSNDTPTCSDKNPKRLFVSYLSLHTIIKFCQLTVKTYLSLNNSHQFWPKPKYSPLSAHPKSHSICTPMFITAFFTIAKRYKKSKCLSMEEWINKMYIVYIQCNIIQL